MVYNKKIFDMWIRKKSGWWLRGKIGKKSSYRDGL